MGYDRIIFVGKNGNCREWIASELLRSYMSDLSCEILARGIVALFPEPVNPKAEAVMASKGITANDFASSQLTDADFSENTLVLTFSAELRDVIYATCPAAKNIHILTELTGDELEILDPHGQDLVLYGICAETLANTVKKLSELLRRPEGLRAFEKEGKSL